jgi:AraC-like DNA-binding protein
VREPGSRDGLTKAQAERELRRRMDAEGATPLGERPTVSEGAERLIDHLEAYGLKATTIATHRSLSRTHFERHFPDRALVRITTGDVERVVAAMRRGGAGAKLINNAITLLGQVFDYGMDGAGATSTQPERCAARVEPSEAIRLLDQAEVEAMLRAAANDTDRVLLLTAVMTGLRQGELLGLQWRDVDWQAGKLHVRRSYVRGHWGTPNLVARAGPCRWPTGSHASSPDTTSVRHKADDELVSATRTSGRCSITRPWCAASSALSAPAACLRCASTISATHSGRAWRRSECRCARSRNGWATATSRPRSSMRTTRRLGANGADGPRVWEQLGARLEPRPHHGRPPDRRPTANEPQAVQGVHQMRPRGFEPPRAIRPTRPSTLRVYQFRHRRVGAPA